MMKICIGSFALYFMLLSIAPCSLGSMFGSNDTCCKADTPKHEPVQDKNDDGSCNGVNPFSFCHCTGSFISPVQNFSFHIAAKSSEKQERDIAPDPTWFSAVIWQPPKF
jgi:hypothetical protein